MSLRAATLLRSHGIHLKNSSCSGSTVFRRGGGHATSTFSHYFNGHKLAFYQTYPDLSVTPLQPQLNSKGNGGKNKMRKLKKIK